MFNTDEIHAELMALHEKIADLNTRLDVINANNRKNMRKANNLRNRLYTCEQLLRAETLTEDRKVAILREVRTLQKEMEQLTVQANQDLERVTRIRTKIRNYMTIYREKMREYKTLQEGYGVDSAKTLH